jgi:hypothetical protein
MMMLPNLTLPNLTSSYVKCPNLGFILTSDVFANAKVKQEDATGTSMNNGSDKLNKECHNRLESSIS